MDTLIVSGMVALVIAGALTLLLPFLPFLPWLVLSWIVTYLVLSQYL